MYSNWKPKSTHCILVGLVFLFKQYTFWHMYTHNPCVHKFILFLSICVRACLLPFAAWPLWSRARLVYVCVFMLSVCTMMYLYVLFCINNNFLRFTENNNNKTAKRRKILANGIHVVSSLSWANAWRQAHFQQSSVSSMRNFLFANAIHTHSSLRV